MTEFRYPFVYIASLPRTGSTLLSEALTAPSSAYIFSEPHFGKNFLRVKPYQTADLAAYDIDLDTFAKKRLPIAFAIRRLRRFGVPQDFMVRELRVRLLPKFSQSKPVQVGVKEIRNGGWQNYLRQFPAMKVVLTARDPRDIYLSYREHANKSDKNKPRKTPFNPDSLAKQLNTEFQHQIQLHQQTDSLKIRYEDLCTQPQLYETIKEFVQSPLHEMGQLGSVIGQYNGRHHEVARHGTNISSKSVGRWRTVTNQEQLSEANKLFDLMPEYCDFWDYER